MPLVENGFWNITIGNVISFGSVALAFLAYWRDQNKQDRQRTEARTAIMSEQIQMHQENQRRLDAVLKFQMT
jgi:uncharacterized membrane protein YebE (DUF533 family)